MVTRNEWETVCVCVRVQMATSSTTFMAWELVHTLDHNRSSTHTHTQIEIVAQQVKNQQIFL